VTRQRFVTSRVLPRSRRRSLLSATPLVLVLLIGLIRAAGLTAGHDVSAQRPSGQADGTADSTLAPLTPGDSVIRTTVERDNHRQDVLAAFRMVP